MMSFTLLPIVFALVLAAFGLLLAGNYIFGKEYKSMISQLNEVSSLQGKEPFPIPKMLQTLPPPVRSYLNYTEALSKKKLPHSSVMVKFQGHIRSRGSEKWARFKATQYITKLPPGFIWIAKISPSWLIWSKGWQAYFEGTGYRNWRLFSTISQNTKKNGKIDQAGLIRYLAETPLFPATLLPGSQLRWEPLTPSSATATIKDSGLEAQAVFHFNEKGQITRIVSKMPRASKLDTMETSWEVAYENYKIHDGIKVPTKVEVKWILPGKAYCYKKYHVSKIVFS